MFEFDKEIVEQLLSDNSNFKELFDKHNELKDKVHDAEIGVHPVDDLTLGEMKKQKLLTKDQMAVIIQDVRRVRA